MTGNATQHAILIDIDTQCGIRLNAKNGLLSSKKNDPDNPGTGIEKVVHGVSGIIKGMGRHENIDEGQTRIERDLHPFGMHG
ncbi:MAG: hypothetical protein JWQ98_1068 [Chlorobi bacterium]|nr:hypothetical protein [Chlorobiota bacterium]